MDKEQWQKKGAGHRSRMRDRFLDKGLDGFSDAEVLELLLSFGTPRLDCKVQARNLLETFGGFSKVLETPLNHLQKVKGVGPKNAFALHFVHAVAGYYLKERLAGKQYLHSSEDVKSYLSHSMRGLKKEILTVIFLDSSHAIIDSEILAEGTINVNAVYPREILKRALDYNAAALIIAHNHPSGSIRPSPQDIKLTKTLMLLCSHMHIKLLDHLILGDGSFSFADNGMIESLHRDLENVVDELSRI